MRQHRFSRWWLLHGTPVMVVRPSPGWCHEGNKEVVDVGAGRPRVEVVVEGRKKMVGIVLGEELVRVDADGTGALKRRMVDDGSGGIGGSISAVAGVCGTEWLASGM